MLQLATILHFLLILKLGHGAMRIVTDPSASFQILWSTNNSHVMFEVSAPTNGYIAFGFSLDGNITSSDLVIGWLTNNSQVHFYDCHWSKNLNSPVIDDSQDYQLISASKNHTHTVLRFRRRYDTCDLNDLPITNDTMRFVYSWHEDEPTLVENHIVLPAHNETMYNNNTGAISVFIFDEPRYEVKPSDDLFVWKVPTANFSIPSKNTTYFCSLHRFTPEDSYRNYVGYNISTSSVFIWHHMSFFQCKVPDSIFADKLSTKISEGGGGGECYEDMEMLILRSFCETPMFTWALGSRGQALPDDVSIPIENMDGLKEYFVMEVHYNNPSQRDDLVDDTVLNVILSHNKRPKEAALMQVATDIGYRLFIPPNQKQFLAVAHCPPECTSKAFPKSGIWIFAVGLHTHLLGRKLKFRHFRNGTELPVIVDDGNYDFNYQELRHLTHPVQVLPGDSLTVECIYDSTSRTTPTFGGFPTHDEMCIAYPVYYPRSSIINCVATAPAALMKKIFGIGYVWHNKTEECTIDPRDNSTINVKDLILSRGEDQWKDKLEVLRDAQWRLPREGSCAWKGKGGNPAYIIHFTSLYPPGSTYVPRMPKQCGEK